MIVRKILIRCHNEAGNQHRRIGFRPQSRADGNPVPAKWQSIQNLGMSNSLYINNLPIAKLTDF